MHIVHSKHDIRLAMPQSINDTADAAPWRASMCDSGWRVLTDFRNWSNWLPDINGVKQTNSEPPSRGTRLQVISGQRSSDCSIDRWDPPRGLHISIEQASGEIAYGFSIEAHQKNAHVLISLELERSLSGIASICAPFYKWRLDKLGKQILTNLAVRVRPAKHLMG